VLEWWRAINRLENRAKVALQGSGSPLPISASAGTTFVVLTSINLSPRDRTVISIPLLIVLVAAISGFRRVDFALGARMSRRPQSGRLPSPGNSLRAEEFSVELPANLAAVALGLSEYAFFLSPALPCSNRFTRSTPRLSFRVLAGQLSASQLPGMALLRAPSLYSPDVQDEESAPPFVGETNTLRAFTETCWSKNKIERIAKNAQTANDRQRDALLSARRPARRFPQLISTDLEKDRAMWTNEFQL